MPATNTRPGPSIADDHALMCRAVREAGAVVLRHFRDRSFTSWAKQDASPVTGADLEANDILRDRLITQGRPHYGWLSEESADDPARTQADRVWIVDPIDGTRAFVEGTPEFTVCAALIEGGKVMASVIFNPATDEFFEAQRGQGALCNGQPLRAAPCHELPDCRILGVKRMFDHPGWPTAWPAMQVGYRNSTAYRMALVAAGRYDAALALMPKADWDVAPGALIASEAGARVSDHCGKEYQFNQAHPWQRALVCSAPSLYPEILSRLAHLPADLRQIKP